MKQIYLALEFSTKMRKIKNIKKVFESEQKAYSSFSVPEENIEPNFINTLYKIRYPTFNTR